MPDDERLDGRWWLPTQPDTQVDGTLILDDPSGIRLELRGTLDDPPDPFSFHEHPTIYGVIPKHLITLIECRQSGNQLSSPGVISESFSCRYAVFDAHLADPSLPQFTEANTEYSHLADWWTPSGIGHGQSERDNDTNLTSSYSLYYRPTESQQYQIGLGSVALSTGARIHERRDRSVTLQEYVVARLSAEQGFSLDALIADFIVPTRDFLTFATTQPCRCTSITVSSPTIVDENLRSQIQDDMPEDVRQVIAEHAAQPVPLRVFQSSPIDNAPQDDRSLVPFHMLFMSSDLKDRLSDAMPKWYALYKEAFLSLQVFFTMQYNRTFYIDQRIVSIVQALESYHRVRRRTTMWPEAKYETMAKAIEEHVAPLSSASRGLVRRSLKYGNEPNLETRLTQLINAEPGAMAPLLPSKKAVHTFAGEVATTRNYLAHLTEELRKRAPSGEKRLRFEGIVLALYQSCLLTELGFTQDEIGALLQRNLRYKGTIDRATEWRALAGV